MGKKIQTPLVTAQQQFIIRILSKTVALTEFCKLSLHKKLRGYKKRKYLPNILLQK